MDKMTVQVNKRLPILSTDARRRQSTRRPAHVTTSEHMEMHVEHRLSCIPPDIGHDSISGLRKPMLMRDLLAKQQEASQQVAIFMRRIMERRHVAFGDDQDMNRRLRIDVAECQRMFILKDNISRNGSFDDSAE
jgi:hypothetical protein